MYEQVIIFMVACSQINVKKGFPLFSSERKREETLTIMPDTGKTYKSRTL